MSTFQTTILSGIATLGGITSICFKISFSYLLSANTTNKDPGVFQGCQKIRKTVKNKKNTHCQVDQPPNIEKNQKSLLKNIENWEKKSLIS